MKSQNKFRDEKKSISIILALVTHYRVVIVSSFDWYLSISGSLISDEILNYLQALVANVKLFYTVVASRKAGKINN